jgi:predicted DNA-binding protein
MANSKPTLASRVPAWMYEWVEIEAERRDRKKAYIMRELLEEGIERRERDREEKAVPA